MQEDIKKYFYAANNIVINEMYLKKFCTDEKDVFKYIKDYNPGHLGTSMSLNFILANLYYLINSKGLTHQLIIGDGHAGVSLLANLWLNGTLEKNNDFYERTITGLNNLISDFGFKIRSEINPEYPKTIYDGGELGYSLGVAYGYSLGSNVDIIPCIIGDGEAETGTLAASWNLIKILKSKSKVLPIINLNGLKMGSPSIFSMMNNNDFYNYFSSLGYNVQIVDSINNNLEEVISKMQKALLQALKDTNPLIIFKSLKGYTLPQMYAGNIKVHKNPLVDLNEQEKVKIISSFLERYNINLFDQHGKLLSLFKKFETSVVEEHEVKRNYIPLSSNGMSIDEYLSKLIKENNCIVFSPDEIFSNGFYKCSSRAIEILNENLLQAMYQGFTQSGGLGYYISYEGFMPILSSMVTQYYKYLKQKKESGIIDEKNSLNYILTSTCWENTYSHQNPDFVNCLFEKNDYYYNILYPKDKNNAIKCIQEFSMIHNKINVLTFSKRHKKVYQELNNTNSRIEVIQDCDNPDIILCATGDYMLDYIFEIYEKIKNNNQNIKIVYVTKPQILSKLSSERLSDDEFSFYFNDNVPVIYLFSGYSMVIKSLLHNRKIMAHVYGYSDGISKFGNLKNNLENNISIDDVINKCDDMSKILKLRR